ncbi:hypothetical protein TIFTF001_033840 [Ficus carica]|uniref:NB-ARC domain-containing protein n=1 Tax=Ficus carica TaxID=3494 RepID=A0AA88E658_FICCA|nr:hypothetical protein TIFTF001_033840 [Ficus carica]
MGRSPATEKTLGGKGNVRDSTELAVISHISLVTESMGLEIEDEGDVDSAGESAASLLKDANAKTGEKELDDSVRNWLKQAKDVAVLIEDIVDECILEVSQCSHRHGFKFLGNAGRLIGTLNGGGKISSDTDNIKELFLDIKERGRDEYLVGLNSSRNELIQRLREGESAHSVVSLVGAGGIGKTTLAMVVYYNVAVRGHFYYCAWITVSPLYRIEELLKMMKTEICAAEKQNVIEKMQRQVLISILRECLRPKRYVLVFDDVWKEEFWGVMKDALPENDNGSRIIITTRKDTIAASCIESSFDNVHKLEPLSEAMSWDLFCTVMFRYEPQLHCPLELEQLSLKFIAMCKGLPLPIVAIAGLLSMKDKEALEWQKLLDNFGTEVRSNIHLSRLNTILSRSFGDFPDLLKLCFMYFGIFAKDALIPNDKLFKLWIAEVFVQQKRGKTSEEVAEEYLKELIHRNLVEECKGFYRLEKFCRVSSLMHEIARQKADEFSFCHMRNDKSSSFKGKVAAYLKFKLLTLLDFENMSLEFVPNELHLKYLSLKDTKVKWLPKSLAKLQNLLKLDLRNTQIVELPVEINRLQNLRHLLASRCNNRDGLDSTHGMRIYDGFSCLEDIQTLMIVEAQRSGIGFAKELKKLFRLRWLGISGLIEEDLSSLSNSIKKMNHLEYLSLYAKTNNENFGLENISISPPLMQRLVLLGLLQKLPHWIPRSENLSMSCLSLSRLNEDPLKHLCELPNLVSLWLPRVYNGEELRFTEGGFLKLKLLVLRELQGLKQVEIERGALPLLEELRIEPILLLNEVPSGIRHLGNPKVLANYDMPAEFVLSMQPNGGSDYWKVKHVPSILFWYRVQGRQYVLCKLGELDLLDHLQGTSATNINSWNCLRFSFCYNDDEADSTITSVAPWNDANRLSFSSLVGAAMI